jgi:hypothetical protein
MQMSTTSRPVPRHPAPRTTPQSRRTSFTEGAIVLIVLYALLGAGIGAACGSFILGLGCGLFIGVFAAAAILLIQGAAQGAKSA